ncbi:hypothetical protein H257_19351, partial [Aphanomyces astaci]
YAMCGFTGCIGFIDGTFFPYEFKPTLCGEDYYSRKGCYAVAAQIIVITVVFFATFMLAGMGQPMTIVCGTTTKSLIAVFSMYLVIITSWATRRIKNQLVLSLRSKISPISPWSILNLGLTPIW